MTLNKRQQQLCDDSPGGFEGLRAIIFNTSLKPNPDDSHTQLLLNVVGDIMERNGIEVDHVHVAARDLAPGFQPDMREHGANSDDWPDVWRIVDAAHIIVIGTPLWLGEESSLCRRLIERMYAMSGMLNNKGQSIFYNKVGGTVITGNEDGAKHAAMTTGFALNHLGCTIPPQADCGWIGEAGPGPSYGDRMDDGSRAGFDNEFTQRNTTIMTWNLMHMARMLRDAGGISNHGNNREAWSAGCRFDHENPEHRS
jgi:multimeric flavodoxin WrbA